jgi:peroxiredoxin
MAIKTGAKAPDFRLSDHTGREFHLSAFKGHNVLLSWHPLAWTGVCAKQMKSLEKNEAKFASLNTVAVGLNIDSVPSKAAWAKALGVKKTRLISDFWPHGGVAKKYGIFRAKNGFSERANIIVDAAGRVIFVKVYEIGTLPDINEILKVLARK